MQCKLINWMCYKLRHCRSCCTSISCDFCLCKVESTFTKTTFFRTPSGGVRMNYL